MSWPCGVVIASFGVVNPRLMSANQQFEAKVSNWDAAPIARRSLLLKSNPSAAILEFAGRQENHALLFQRGAQLLHGVRIEFAFSGLVAADRRLAHV